MESTEDKIEFFNQSLAVIKERVKHVFGLDILIEPIMLTPPDRYDSFMRAYEEHATQQLTQKSLTLFKILRSQNIFNYQGSSPMPWSNTRSALTDIISKLQKY